MFQFQRVARAVTTLVQKLKSEFLDTLYHLKYTTQDIGTTKTTAGRNIMIRVYNTGVQSNIRFFVGTEIEKTPAYGMKTLFVAGLVEPSQIEKRLGDCTHIFFGANHSFDYFCDAWLEMMTPFLDRGMWCSLDIPYNCTDQVLHSVLNEYETFIPQIRIPLPYVKRWNKNTTIKFDDVGFNETNPGVWVHPLRELTNDSAFTPWELYKNDKILK